MPKNYDDVNKRFKALVADIMGVKPNTLKDGTRFVEDLHAKSIDTIALTAAAEGEFKIKLTPGEANRNTTIKKTVDCIVSKMRGRD